MMEEGKSIIMIDSEKGWLQFCQQILEKSGYTIYTALSKEEAKYLLASQPDNEVDLVILDIKVLEEDETLISFLSRSGSDKERPVVVVFATELTPNRAREAFKLGASDCVSKPYDEAALLAFIEQARADYRVATLKAQYISEGTHTVLVIDDDKDWQASLVKYLPPGNHVETATNYEAALEKFLQFSPDLIITDLRLRDNDVQGIDLINEVRQQDKERGAFTPIIVVSAYGTPEYIRDCYRNFNVAYFFDKKYLSPSKYRDSIKKILSLHKN